MLDLTKPIRFIQNENGPGKDRIIEVCESGLKRYPYRVTFEDNTTGLCGEAELENVSTPSDEVVEISDTKPTNSLNPKDAIGLNKLPMGGVPDTLVTYAALAFLEGAAKYGRFNWRIAGVRASIYHDALRRHIASWWNGETVDPATGIPHLANALACIGIILDAEVAGKLTDDRPPAVALGEKIRQLATEIPRIKALFADHNPPQYTIADSEKS